MSGFSEAALLGAALFSSSGSAAPPVDHERAGTAFSRVAGQCFDKQAAIRNNAATAVNVPDKNQSGAFFVACTNNSTLFTQPEIALTVIKVWHTIADSGRIDYRGEVATVPIPPVTLANGTRYPGLTSFVGDSQYETRNGKRTGCLDNKLVIEVDDGKRTRLATGIYTFCPKAGMQPGAK
jgi:hypothetical protein